LRPGKQIREVPPQALAVSERTLPGAGCAGRP
jgi:hypothetical protein